MDVLKLHVDVGEWFLLEGPPGCGKTKRVAALGAASGRKVFRGIGGRTADLMDRLDVAGTPYPRPEKGITEMLPLGELREILACEVPALWFVDEIGRALMEVQGGLCSVFDVLADSRPNVMVVAATNRPKDKAGVSALTSQFMSRFQAAYEIATPESEPETDDTGAPVTTGTVKLQPWCCEDATLCDGCEVCGWCDWAASAGMPPELIGWHRWTKGRTLYTWKSHSDPAMRCGDFRTWAAAGKAWNLGIRDLRTMSARVGKGHAAEFLGFAKVADTLPAMASIWSDPNGAKIPPESNPGGLFLLSARLVAGINAQTAEATFTYLNRLPRLFGALIGRDAYRQKGAMLEGVAAAGKWYVQNQALFAVN